jgi:hypothetical protein
MGLVAGCPPTPPPANFGIEASPTNLVVPGDVVRLDVTGHGFTPNGRVSFSYTGLPGDAPTVQLPGSNSIDSQGNFSVQAAVIKCVEMGDAEASGEFVLYARDQATGNVALKALKKRVVKCSG